jgi:hypothetical protein
VSILPANFAERVFAWDVPGARISLKVHSRTTTQLLYRLLEPSTSKLETCGLTLTSAMFDDWRRIVRVQREQHKSSLTLSQSRSLAVHALRMRSSRDCVLILFHSWKLCAQFGAKVHRVLLFNIRHAHLTNATMTKKAVLDTLAAVVLQSRHTSSAAEGRALLRAQRTVRRLFGDWLEWARASTRNQQKAGRIMLTGRIMRMSLAFGDWITVTQHAKSSMQQDTFRRNLEAKVARFHQYDAFILISAFLFLSLDFMTLSLRQQSFSAGKCGTTAPTAAAGLLLT